MVASFNKKKSSLKQGNSRAVLNYIYTLSGPPRKARAKPSNHLEKKYLARIEDIYKKRKKMVVRLKNKVRKHFLNFWCVFFEFMQ